MTSIQHIILYFSEFYQNNFTLDLLLVAFIAVFFLQVLYYGIFFIPVLFHKKKQADNHPKLPVSVIICAKNEEENLKNNLPRILEQDYPDFEVIVINDGSSDNTEEFLGTLREKYDRLKFSNIVEDKKFNHGKKLALTVGIKAAQNEHLILTDADCYPVSKKWIDTIQHNFSDTKKIILGYGKYEEKKGLLNKMIRFETLFVAMQYFGFAKVGIPYMGVGRNLAYNKSLFFENKGFASHAHILSGDDDLFVNEVANKQNTTIEMQKDGHTISSPKSSFNDWIKQKRRHLSTGRHYKFLHKFLLIIEPFSRISFYVFVILLFIISYNIKLIALLFVFKIVLLLVVTKLIMKRLDEKGIWFYSLLFDLVIPVLNSYFLFSNYLLRKKNKWK